MRWWSTSSSFSRHRTSWHKQKSETLPRNNTPPAFPAHPCSWALPTASVAVRESCRSSSHCSSLPSLGCGLISCSAVAQTLPWRLCKFQTTFVPERCLQIKAALRGDKSGATLTKVILLGRMRSTVSCCWKEDPPESSLQDDEVFLFPSFFPSVSLLLSSKARLRGPKQLHARNTSQVWQSFSLMFSPQARSKWKIKKWNFTQNHFLKQSLCHQLTFLWWAKREWAEKCEQEMLSSESLPVMKCKGSRNGSWAQASRTVSTGRLREEELGESSRLTLKSSPEQGRDWDCKAHWVSSVTALLCY